MSALSSVCWVLCFLFESLFMLAPCYCIISWCPTIEGAFVQIGLSDLFSHFLVHKDRAQCNDGRSRAKKIVVTSIWLLRTSRCIRPVDCTSAMRIGCMEKDWQKALVYLKITSGDHHSRPPTCLRIREMSQRKINRN